MLCTSDFFMILFIFLLKFEFSLIICVLIFFIENYISINCSCDVIKDGEIKRVINILSETKDTEKCVNIVKDLLRVLVEGLIFIDIFYFISNYFHLILYLNNYCFYMCLEICSDKKMVHAEEIVKCGLLNVIALKSDSLIDPVLCV